MGCKVEKINAPNGKPSRVYKEVADVYGTEVGVMAYLTMHSDAFQKEHKEHTVDANGEHNWQTVLDYMEKNNTSPVAIVAKANGTMKANNTLVKFESKAAMKMVDFLNKEFKKDGMPFMAEFEEQSTGKSVIHITSTDNNHKDVLRKLNDFNEESDNGFDIDKSDYSNKTFGAESSLDRDDFDFNPYKIFDEDDTESATKKGHRFYNVMQKMKLERKGLETRLTRTNDALVRAKKADNFEKIGKLQAKAHALQFRIDKLVDDEAATLNLTHLRHINNLAELDLIQIAKADLDNMEIDELVEVKRKLDFWAKAGDFKLDTNEEHILFTDDDLGSKALRKVYADFALRANHLKTGVTARLEEKFERFLKDNINEKVGMKDAMKLASDLGILTSHGLDISRTDDIIFQSIYKEVTTAQQRAKMMSDKIDEEVDAMMPDVIEALKQVGATGNIFDLFSRMSKDGKKTGDAVSLVSVEFERAKQQHYNNVIYNANKTHKEKAAARKWREDNEVFFDPRLLYEDKSGIYSKAKPGYKFDPKAREKHILRLKEQIDPAIVDATIAKMDKEFAEYEQHWIAKNTYEAENAKTEQEHHANLKIWDRHNSPFWAAESHASTSGMYFLGKAVKSHSIYTMPKSHVKGQQTEWYDKSYAKIQSNPTLKKFYDYYISTMADLNRALPQSERKKLKENSVVYIQKTLEEMKYDGDKRFFKGAETYQHLKDKTTEALRSNDVATIVGSTFDPATGEQVRQIQTNFTNQNKGQLQNIVKRKHLEWQGRNIGKTASKNHMTEWRYEALDELAQEKSFDLGAVLKSYAQLANAYKYKADIADRIHLAHNMFGQINEGLTNAQGDQLKDEYDNKKYKKGLENKRKQLDYYMNSFDNHKMKKETSVGEKKYTSVEQEHKKSLENTIKVAEEAIADKKLSKVKGELIIKDAQEQLDALGAKTSATKAGDNLLKLVQIKGMGWNYPAAMVNLWFGQISNWIVAGSGKHFKPDKFGAAFKAVWTPKGRKKSANLIKKFGILVDNLDIKTSTNNGGILGRAPKLIKDPYEIGNMAEIKNQTPLMVAKMMSIMLPDGKGGEVSLWKAMDDDGNLLPEYANVGTNKEDWNGDLDNPAHNKKLHQFITDTKQMIKSVHGNYDINSPVLGKETFYGRAGLQFRSWLAESVASHFEAEKYDAVLGTHRKGRLRALISGTKDADGNPFNQAKIFIEILRQATKLGLSKNGAGLRKVDVEAISEAARELQAALGMMMLGIMAAAAHGQFEDEDEDDKLGGIFGMEEAMTLTCNMINKTAMDLRMFYNPTWPADILANPAASLTIVQDLTNVLTAAMKAMGGDTRIETGINADTNRLWKEVRELVPITSSIYSLNSMSSKIYEDPRSVGATSSALGADLMGWLFDVEDD